MHSLIIVNSVYQLFTAVHVKRSLLAQETADVLLTDATPPLRACGPRLAETGLFDHVLYGHTKDLANRYMTGTQDEISEGYRKAASLLRFASSAELATYDQVLFANPDTFVRMLAAQLGNTPTRFVWYEDGFSTYVIDYFRPDRAAVNRHPEGKKLAQKIDCVLLYEPSLAIRGDALPHRAIPKVDPHDAALRQLLNRVFDYHHPVVPERFLFLEQSFRAENIRSNDLELMALCRQSAASAGWIVKPHPRNPVNVAWERGLTRRYPGDAPWELYLMNELARGAQTLPHVLVTVCSNAALTARLIFGEELPIIMLYELFQGKVLWKEDDVLRRYLRLFRSQFGGPCYYVPKTVFELRAIVQHLAKTALPLAGSKLPSPRPVPEAVAAPAAGSALRRRKSAIRRKR